MVYQFKNASILVVEDTEPMLALVSSLLEAFGFSRIYKAADAEQGLQLFLEHNPDIVLIDWQMEPYNGIELVRRMRGHPQSPNMFVPIIMMTGYSHKIRVEEARNVGVTEFLAKPFKARDLYARIKMLIEKPRRFVEAEAFFGPDRRRRKMKAEQYKGPKRRDAEEGALSEEPGPFSSEDAWFVDLRHRARDIHGDIKDEERKDDEES